MLSTLIFFLLLLLRQTFSAVIETPKELSLHKRETEICQTVTNGCPNLNFDFKSKCTNTLKYDLKILNVEWLHENLYQITINVKGEKQIPLKYLYSLKIIEVDGPQGTVQLYGKNENTYLIDNPTDFTATFQIYGGSPRDRCDIWLPNFQIQYEYLQGDAAQYADTWEWGTTAFDLISGCNNFDNMGNSQTDFPGYYWKINCDDRCHILVISTTITSSPTSSKVPVTSTRNIHWSFSSSIFKPYPNSTFISHLSSSTTPVIHSTWLLASSTTETEPALTTTSATSTDTTLQFSTTTSTVTSLAAVTTTSHCLSSTLPTGFLSISDTTSHWSSSTLPTGFLSISNTTSHWSSSTLPTSFLLTSNTTSHWSSSTLPTGFLLTSNTTSHRSSSTLPTGYLLTSNTTSVSIPILPSTTTTINTTANTTTYSITINTIPNTFSSATNIISTISPTTSPTSTFKYQTRTTSTLTMTQPTSNVIPPVTPNSISEYLGKGNILNSGKITWLIDAAFIFIFNVI
ncbi:uncharacterized protein NDAI_0D00690 [Naumovozyma dairenensis CBS 421]|uniref:Flo11 domain-containing protein n=1 Tax=Naumovozyma dairenensis (strain ATCC 10597 / BCRC 20456 / CBS 421 / NBRC 0211 / NRRL Y-12639) TaxID=1071378 RepID=G0W9C2_NAUDC|nr:hypothetical protein NDAI_0D00690 [Naumovozyma dairenensis CBS 421]CCD24383.1 hypothetical protein NDAI_0D00690 [Naumovozyma dairenensis CBS 421]